MARSGTIKTLAALVAALTIGTWALIWMETAPARPMIGTPLVAEGATPSPVQRVPAIYQTDVPLQFKWRNVVIHDISRDRADIVRNCHFVIGNAEHYGDGEIMVTPRWKRQDEGRHIVVPGFNYNADSIGICLLADGGKAPPTPKQMQALTNLVRNLQMAFQLRADYVYLHSDLGDPRPTCPGQFFPASEFRARLLPSADMP